MFIGLRPPSSVSQSVPVLVLVLVQELAVLHRERERHRMMASSYSKRVQVLEQQVVSLQAVISKLNFRQNKKTMTVFGGITLAVKSAPGYASAKTAVALVAGDECRGSFAPKHLMPK